MRIIKSIQNRIYDIGDQRVMLDFDLAIMYEVDTNELRQTIEINNERFPKDFLFQLTSEEWLVLKRDAMSAADGTSLQPQNSLIVQRERNPDITPFAFTARGVAMLSSVLNSPKAIRVNLSLMSVIAKTKNISDFQFDSQIPDVFEALINLDNIVNPAPKWNKREPIGFRK